MYFWVLFAHSWMRWLVVISLFIVLFKSFYGFFKNTPYTKCDNISAMILIGSTHAQIVLGLWLYFFLSPITLLVPGENFMKEPTLRYWKLEHFIIMIVFLIFVQTGRILSKKSATDKRKHKMMAIFSLIALIVLAFGMPWPNKQYGRPLFRAPLALAHTAK